MSVQVAPGRVNLWSDGEIAAPAPSIPFITFSPDSRRMAYVMQDAGGYRTVTDEGAGATYDAITTSPADSAPVFSSDGERLAFIARRANEWFVVIDGKEIDAGQARPSSLVFSADCRTLAFVLCGPARGTDYYNVWIGGKTLPGLGLGITSLRLSADGQHYVYALENRPESWTLVNDGVMSGAYLRISDVQLTADGKHVAAIGQITADKDAASQFDILTENGGTAGPFMVVTGRPEFLSGDRLFYACIRASGSARFAPGGPAYSNEEVFAMLDGMKLPPRPEGIERAFESSDRKHRFLIGNIAPMTNQFLKQINLDGTGIAGSFCCGFPTIDSTGTRLAYVDAAAYADHKAGPDKWAVAVNDKQFATYAAVGPPLFSPDGKHLAYAAERNIGDEKAIWSIVHDESVDSPGGNLILPTADLGDGGTWTPDGKLPGGMTWDEADYFLCPQLPYQFDIDGALHFFFTADASDGPHIYRGNWKADGQSILPLATRPATGK